MTTLAPAVTVLGEDPDDRLTALRHAFGRYTTDHDGSRVEIYRLDEWTTTARVIDPRFVGMSPGERHDAVWSYLIPLSPEQLADLCAIVKIAPGEELHSGANQRFEDEMPRAATIAAAA